MADPKQSAQRAARSDTMEALARAGYSAKGLVYGTVGVLALKLALGEGGQTVGSRDALRTLAGQPLGQVLLALLAVGLIGHALWRFAQGFVNVEHEAHDAGGAVYRFSYVVSGLIHLGLAVYAGGVLFGMGSAGGSGGASSWTAKVMDVPFGRLLIGAAGLAVLAYGLYQLYKALGARFMDRFKSEEMDAARARAVKRIGQFGIAARGVVFSLIGVFVIKAALEAQSAEARGLEGALDALRQQAYGPYLLGTVAAGLVAYALYCLFLARYRRIAS